MEAALVDEKWRHKFVLLSLQPDYDEIYDENGYKAFSTTRPSKEKLLMTDKKYGN